jgi:hypothetical protein
MPDTAVFAALPGGDATTRAVPPKAEVARAVAVTGLTGQTGNGAAPRTDCLAELIMPLRALIDALPIELPEPLRGETWLYFDSAITGLYGALAALEDIDRMRHVPDQLTYDAHHGATK